MTTEQSYGGKESPAILSEGMAKNEESVTSELDNRQNIPLKSLVFGDPSTTTGKHTITVFSAFGSILRNPVEVNRLRQDIRSWFTAYVPQWEDGNSECSLTESLNNYALLDHFLSALINEGIHQIQKGGQNNE